MKDLYPHQQAGIDFIHHKDKAILAFCVRAGKSACALLAARDEDEVVIICPLLVLQHWIDEIRLWRPGWTWQVLRSPDVDMEHKHNVYLIPDSVLFRVWRAQPLIVPDFLVVDEAHRFKNPKAQRSRAMVSMLRETERAAILSGTIMPNRPSEAWVWVSELLGKRNQKAFEERYCGGWNAPWGWDTSGATHQDEFAELLSQCMLTVTAEELHDTLAQILPPMLIYLDLPPDHREKEFNRERIIRNPHTVAFEALSDIRHLDGLRKVGHAVNHVRLLLETEYKILVWGYHRDVLEEIYEGLWDYSPAMIHGGTRDREAERIRFQEDPDCWVFIGQVEAAGVGITLDAGAINVVVECPWVPGVLNQAIARCGGPEQPQAVRTDILTISESIDGHVLTSILNKTAVIDNLNEETKMPKAKTQLPKMRNWKLDHALRDALEARAMDRKVTVLAYLEELFPKCFDVTAAPEKEEPVAAQDLVTEPVKEQEISADDVRLALAKAIRKVGADPIKKALNELGAQRLSEVKPSQYANLLEICEEWS